MVECESKINRQANQCKIVLIDTWWNVNINVENPPEWLSACFNRYMVECEFHQMRAPLF